MLSDPDLIHLIHSYIERADNNSGSTLEQNYSQATNYYLGRMEGREPADPALSEQVSGDVADMTDAVMAEMSVSLLGTDAIAEFEAKGGEDIGARVEGMVTNKVIMDQNPGYEILSNAVQSCCLYKVGVVAIEPVTIERSRSRFVGVVEPEQKAILEGETDGEIDDDGQLNWTEMQRRVQLRNVAPENWFVDKEYPGWTLDNSNFCAERIYFTRGDLVDMGYSWETVKDLSETTVLNTHQEVTERYANRAEDSRSQATDEQELVETYYVYLRLSEAGHNLRLFKLHIADDVVLSKEPVDDGLVGYAIGRIIPMTNRFHGVSLHDRLKPIEDGMTQAYRQLEDNLAYGNNTELSLGPTANVDDANNRIPGGYIRREDPNDVTEIPHGDVTTPAVAYIEQMKGLRSERGGSALDMQRADSQIMRGSNQVGSMGVGMLMSAAELRTAWYTRNIAETLIRQVFIITHRTLRRFEMDPIGISIMGQYVEVNPSQFTERESVNVRSGMSSSERVRLLQALDSSINMQVQLTQVAGPGVLGDLSTLHQMLVDRDKAAGIDNPTRYWIDPKSQQSLQAQQSNAQGQQQQQQIQMQLEQADKQLEAQKIQLDKYKHDGDLEHKYYDTNVDAGLQEAKMTLEAVKSDGDNNDGEDTQESDQAA